MRGYLQEHGWFKGNASPKDPPQHEWQWLRKAGSAHLPAQLTAGNSAPRLSSSSAIISCLYNLRKEPQESCDFLSFLNWASFISYLCLMTLPPLSRGRMLQLIGNSYTATGPCESQDNRVKRAVLESWLFCKCLRRSCIDCFTRPPLMEKQNGTSNKHISNCFIMVL